jgi:hypothetical protein
MTKLLRLARPMVLGAVAAGAMLVAPIPAGAAVADVGLGSLLALSSPYHVVPACSISAGATTNGSQVTWVVSGSASSYSTNGSTPLDTGIECFLNGNKVVQQVLVGADSAGVGTWTLSSGTTPNVQACGEAFFSNGGIATFPPGCWQP